MRAGRLSGCLSVALCLAASAAWAQQNLSGAEIRSKVTGNTLTVVTEQLKTATGYFAPDGALRGYEGGERFVGTWRVADDLLCLDLPEDDFDICRRVAVQGDALLLFTEAGSPGGQAEIGQGNPNNF